MRSKLCIYWAYNSTVINYKAKVNGGWLLLIIFSKIFEKGDALKKISADLQAKINQNRELSRNLETYKIL